MSVESNIRTTDTWFVGEDKVLEFIVKNSVGVVQDITGWTLSYDLCDKAGVKIAKTSGSGITITDAGNGVVQVVIDAADTVSPFQAGTYKHALRRTDAGSAQLLTFGSAVLRSACPG